MNKQQMTIPVFIPHLGCPHKCSFCNQNSASDTKKPPDAESVIFTVEEYLKTARKDLSRIEVAFFGGSFTAIPASLQESYLTVLQPYLANGLIQSVRLSTRPDCINKKNLFMLKDYGVKTIELGAQSFYDEVLVASQRGHNVSDTETSSLMIKEAGFDLVIQLMPGLPLDTPEKSMQSLKKALKLSPDAIRIYPAVVIKNTELENNYRDGQYKPYDLEQTIELCASMHIHCAENQVPVIRTGLHPFTPETSDTIIAGPYHPALGFLVKARIKRNELNNLIESRTHIPAFRKKKIHLLLPEKNKEEYIGMKRENIAFLKRKFNIEEIKVSYQSGNKPDVMLLNTH